VVDYDVIVAGLGGMGSAAAAHLARRGVRVLGIDQYARGHTLGASSGKSRIIRRAYFESPEYVPLLQRAYTLWHELEEQSSRQLYFRTGLLTVGTENSDVVAGAREAAMKHGIAIELIDSTAVREKYPALAPLPEEVAVYESDAGYVVPEATVEAHLALAEHHGATLAFEQRFRDWETYHDEVVVRYGVGKTATAARLVLALGPWSAKIFANTDVKLKIQRNVIAWWDPAERLTSDEMPCFLVDRKKFPALIYGFPDSGDGVKAGFHGYGLTTTPEALDRNIDMSADVAPLAHSLHAFIPGATKTFREAKACMYSLTRDEHFVIDFHPADSRVIIAGGFSGHGFKFVPVVGEILAQLALDGGTPHPIEFLSMKRFPVEA
jgi:sarcosine oxidase